MDGLVFWTKFLIDDFGIPALIGGFIWAIPSSFITYYYVFQFVTVHRTKLAQKNGLTLEEWEKIHIHSIKEILSEIKKN